MLFISGYSGKCNFILTRHPLNILISEIIDPESYNRFILSPFTSRTGSLTNNRSVYVCGVFVIRATLLLRNTLLLTAVVFLPFPLVHFRCCCCSWIRSLVSVVALLEHIFPHVIFLNFRKSASANSRPSI